MKILKDEKAMEKPCDCGGAIIWRDASECPKCSALIHSRGCNRCAIAVYETDCCTEFEDRYE